MPLLEDPRFRCLCVQAVNVEVVSLEVGNWDKDLRQFKFEKFDDPCLPKLKMSCQTAPSFHARKRQSGSPIFWQSQTTLTFGCLLELVIQK